MPMKVAQSATKETRTPMSTIRDNLNTLTNWNSFCSTLRTDLVKREIDCVLFAVLVADSVCCYW